jgi:fructose-bisphosphate aldolase class 1
MKIRQLVLRLFTPESEKVRMQVREALCHAEASAEDLTRTMVMHEETIRHKISEGRALTKKMNGNHKEQK